jgi:hypothetical protein
VVAGADEDGMAAGAERTALTPDAVGPLAHGPTVKPSLSDPSDTEPVIEGKWPRSATLAFIVGVCGLFWLAVALAAGLLLH